MLFTITLKIEKIILGLNGIMYRVFNLNENMLKIKIIELCFVGNHLTTCNAHSQFVNF